MHRVCPSLPFPPPPSLTHTTLSPFLLSPSPPLSHSSSPPSFTLSLSLRTHTHTHTHTRIHTHKHTRPFPTSPSFLPPLTTSLTRAITGVPAYTLCTRGARARRSLHAFPPLDPLKAPAAFARSLGTLAHRPPAPWVKAYLAATKRKLSGFVARDLASCLWGLAVLGVRPGPAWMQVRLYMGVRAAQAGLACGARVVAVWLCLREPGGGGCPCRPARV